MARKRVRLETPGEESLDLIARKVIMASLIYYGLDEAIVSDAQFDKWCKRLAKLWHRLDDFRQWQLGSREQIRASGFHVRVTQAALGGATSWLAANGLLKAAVVPTGAWQRSKRRKVDHLPPNAFTWQAQPPKRRQRVQLEPKRKRIRL